MWAAKWAIKSKDIQCCKFQLQQSDCSIKRQGPSIKKKSQSLQMLSLDVALHTECMHGLFNGR